MKKLYAVANGYHTGIFQTWEECKREVNEYSGAKYKGFSKREDAQKWLDENIDGNNIVATRGDLKYYAVAVGRKTGIYLTWEDCKQQVDRYPGAQYKCFKNEIDARVWLVNQIRG